MMKQFSYFERTSIRYYESPQSGAYRKTFQLFALTRKARS